MKDAAAVPPGEYRVPMVRRRRLQPVRMSDKAAVSVGLHVLVLALGLWLTIRHPKGMPQASSAAQVSMVFASENAPGSAPKPAPGEAHPETSPGPSSPVPSTKPAETPPPVAQSAPPEVNIAPELPEPPPELPQAENLLTPTPRRPVSPHPPRPTRPKSPFANVMNFSFNTPSTRPPPGHSGNSHTIDMGYSIPQPHTNAPPGGATTGGMQVQQVSGPALGRDWFGQLSAWWLKHRYYPDQAAAAGEDGIVGIQIIVDPYGHVQRVEIESRSGSVWLDAGALSIFRNAKLPPFPPGADTGGNATINISIDYILTR